MDGPSNLPVSGAGSLGPTGPIDPSVEKDKNLALKSAVTLDDLPSKVELKSGWDVVGSMTLGYAKDALSPFQRQEGESSGLFAKKALLGFFTLPAVLLGSVSHLISTSCNVVSGKMEVASSQLTEKTGKGFSFGALGLKMANIPFRTLGVVSGVLGHVLNFASRNFGLERVSALPDAFRTSCLVKLGLNDQMASWSHIIDKVENFSTIPLIAKDFKAHGPSGEKGLSNFGYAWQTGKQAIAKGMVKFAMQSKENFQDLLDSIQNQEELRGLLSCLGALKNFHKLDPFVMFSVGNGEEKTLFQHTKELGQSLDQEYENLLIENAATQDNPLLDEIADLGIDRASIQTLNDGLEQRMVSQEIKNATLSPGQFDSFLRSLSEKAVDHLLVALAQEEDLPAYIHKDLVVGQEGKTLYQHLEKEIAQLKKEEDSLELISGLAGKSLEERLQQQLEKKERITHKLERYETFAKKLSTDLTRGGNTNT